MYRIYWSARLSIVLMLAALAEAAPADPARRSPELVWQKIRTTQLEPDRAVAVQGLVLNTGMARFKIARGTFFPATPVGERTVEMVFQGEATLELEPPDEIEAGQLDLFTGSPALEERVTEAVLVVNLDAAADMIFRRPPISGLDVQARDRAEATFEQWRSRPERRLLGVESAIFRDAFGDPLYEGYFAGWFRGDELEELLYLVDPSAPEQVTLGRFSTLDANDKQERKLARRLHRQQRKGRLIGVSMDALGFWDTWLSSSHRTPDGKARPGSPAFEPRHYELDLVLAEPDLALRGRSRLHLQALYDGVRIVKLELHSDLRVERASLADGPDLFFRQSENVEIENLMAEVLVVLPQAPQRGEDLVLEIETSGHLIRKAASGSYALRSTTHWYPHAGTTDRATYDVTLHWPAKLDVVAGGRLVDSGIDGNRRRFERRRLEHPTFAFGFEVGKFRTLTGRAGAVEVTLACDAASYRYFDKPSREKLLATLVDTLEYFEQTFGPYPLDRMVVVTAQRSFSQSLLGFVTLSTAAMSDESWLTWVLGFKDRRTVIAHEVAHQWWGHVVAWQSYRDQWISEAMANYAAVLYARHRLDALPFTGPTSGWRQAMTRTVKNGRPVESIGPLILGQRLASSISYSAYQSIVYKKGAVVLDMLARGFGEEAFLEILRLLVAGRAFHQVSTEMFIHLIEQISQTELDAFARQFIYGTGLPEVYYSYTFEPDNAGGWVVKLAARQETPYRYDYRVVQAANGTLDVARRRLDQTELDDSTLYVPIQIAVFKADAQQSLVDRQTGLDPKVSGNALMVSHLALYGESSELTLPIDHEPKELWLDRQGEVFGRFFNEHRHPKRMLYYQGSNQAAAGSHAKAEALFHRALAADVFSGPSYEYAPKAKDLEATGRRLDAWIRSQLVRLYLDQGRTGDARATFDQLHQRSSKSIRQVLGAELRHLEARLAIHEGAPEQAYKMLRKPVLKRGVRGATEGLLLLAIAAHATGHADDYQTALEAAAEKGADVTVLDTG